MHVNVWEHVASLYYRNAWWIFTKLGRNEVLMVPYKCFSARSAHGWIQGGVKIGQRGTPSPKDFFTMEGYSNLSWVYWGFTSHATIFQSYLWRHRCEGGLKKKLYIRSDSNAIDISQGSLTCPSYTDEGPPFLYDVLGVLASFRTSSLLAYFSASSTDFYALES